jgi:hypothetical protein
LFVLLKGGESSTRILIDNLNNRTPLSHLRIPSGNRLFIGSLDIGQDFCAESDCSATYKPPKRLALTVGDVCYYLLGQIWNLNYRPVARREDTTFHGQIWALDLISARPSMIRGLRRRFAYVRKNLLDDVLTKEALGSNSPLRAIGALERLRFFYPQHFQRVATQLASRIVLPTTRILRDLESCDRSGLGAEKAEVLRRCSIYGVDPLVVLRAVARSARSVNRTDLSAVFEPHQARAPTVYVDEAVADWLMRSDPKFVESLKAPLVKSRKFWPS